MSQPNINVEKLRLLLVEMARAMENGSPNVYGVETLIDAAFPPQPKEEWRPKEGDAVYLILHNGDIVLVDFEDYDKRLLEMNFVHPTRAAAEAFLAKYKEWLRGGDNSFDK